MKFINKNPLIVLLIVVFLTIVVGAAGYFLLVGPRKATIDNKQKEIEGVRNEIDTEKQTNKKLLETKNKATEYEAKLAQLDAVIPQDPQLPQLIRNLQAAADPGTGAGLPWLSFSPAEISSGETGAGYNTYNFSMSVAGYYKEINDLVYRIERFPRAVIIESLSINSTNALPGWNEVWGSDFEDMPELLYIPGVQEPASNPLNTNVPMSRVINENWGLVQAEISAKTFTYAEPKVGSWESQQTSAPAAAPQTEGTE